MLKAVQILFIGCSSGLVSQRSCSLRLSSVAAISSRSTSSFCSFSRPISPMASSPTRQFKQFRASSAPSDVNSDPPPSALVQLAGNICKIKFCHSCGGQTKHEIPNGEERMRAICTVCGKIIYQNPKMVVGCLIAHDNKVLLCKRKIQPSYGLWTLPAGYMEIGESAAEGAIRETMEEANAEVEVISPFAQLDIPLIGQTYLIYLAELKQPSFSPGPESSECQLFPLDEIPFNSLAFSSMVVALNLYIEDLKAGEPKFHYGVIRKRPGTAPSDIHAYALDQHMQS